MHIIKNTSGRHLTALRGGMDDFLHHYERVLLSQVSATLTIIHGGQFKNNKKIASSIDLVK